MVREVKSQYVYVDKPGVLNTGATASRRARRTEWGGGGTIWGGKNVYETILGKKGGLKCFLDFSGGGRVVRQYPLRPAGLTSWKAPTEAADALNVLRQIDQLRSNVREKVRTMEIRPYKRTSEIRKNTGGAGTSLGC